MGTGVSVKQAPLRFGGVPEHFNYPIRLASKDTNATFTWTEYGGGSGAMGQALREGELDCAIMLTEAATLLAHRNEVKIIGAYTTTPLCWGVHTSSTRECPPLKDATYGISRFGSGSHLMALVDARHRKVPPPTFHVVRNLEGARVALREGTADIFMWEKFTTKPLVNSKEWVRVAEVPTPWPAFAVVATNDIAKERVDDIKDVLQRIAVHSIKMQDLHEEIAEEYGQKLEDVQDWLGTVQWATGTKMSRAILENTTAALVDAKLLESDEQRLYDDLVADFTADKAIGKLED